MNDNPIFYTTEIDKDKWKKHSNLIRKLINLQPLHEQLASEVAYILEKRLKKDGIEFSTVTSRAKSLLSFLEKLERKTYGDPLSEISDLSGVRIVYLYSSDFDHIKEIISTEFKILETIDKLSQQSIDKFGYSAVHYVVRLSRKSSGARYDDLKKLRCEIQVRTVLQDAWSIISHHIVYKREKDIPSILHRRINAMAGLLETADDQFDRIRLERQQYIDQIQGEDLMEQEINIDTVVEFLKSYYHNLQKDIYREHISWVLRDINRNRYRNIDDLRDLMDRTSEARNEFEKFYDGIPLSPAGALAVALGIDDPEYRETDDWDGKEYQAMEYAEKFAKNKNAD